MRVLVIAVGRHDVVLSALTRSRAGESSCTVLIDRSGIEMTEAPPDNAMQRQFVGQIWSSRISSCCACHEALSLFRRSFARRTYIEPQRATHNLCICFDRHDHTCHNPGDKLLAAR